MTTRAHAVRWTDPEWDGIVRVAENADMTPSDFVRDAVAFYLDSINGDEMPALSTVADLVKFVEASDRYKFPQLADGIGRDFARVLCRDCSSRSTVALVPTYDLADHETAHRTEPDA